MYLEVYPDIIFILNFIVDFILISLLKMVNRKSSSILRKIGAASIGAIMAVMVSIFPWMNVLLRFLLMYVVASVLMICLAFGRLKLMDMVKQVVALYLITYFVGGLINSIYYHTNFKNYMIDLGNGLVFSDISLKFIIITFLIIIPVSIILHRFYLWYQSNAPLTYEVELIFDGQKIKTNGLMDTGNCLYDPIYKRPVMVVENSLMEELLSPENNKSLNEAKQYVEANKNDTSQWNINTELELRLRFVPYQSIGKKQGMLVGLVLDKVLIHTGKETICNERVTAAVCDNQLSTKEDYHVILHKEFLSGI